MSQRGLVVVDMRAMHRAVAKMDAINKRAMPHAIRDTLNMLAFSARRDMQRRMGQQMTLRNRYTTRSIAVDKARGVMVPAMESRVGSLQPYMATQELGGTVSSKGRHGVTIPTSTASGEGMSARPRKRLVRRANWLSAIRLAGRGSGSAKQRNAIAISRAIRSGTRTAFLDLGQRKGIVRIMGGKRRPKVRMLWDMSKRSVRIKANPTLQPSMDAAQRRAPRVAQVAAMRQIKRALGRGR